MPTGDAATLRADPIRVENPMPRPSWLLILALAAGPAFALDPIRAPQPLEAPPPDAIETATGMSYVVLAPGPKPERTVAGEFVEFRLDMWSSDGATRASARETGPRTVAVRALAKEQPGIARALLSTPIGETRRWWIRPERMRPGYSGMPDLLHVLDLTVVAEADPLAPPADLAAPPADALRTAGGIAYKVVRRGAGGPHPGPTSSIRIDYTGWTPDGRAFDSSLRTGAPAIFPLDKLIEGWQQGVPLMSRGDTFRFWIPGHLAYDAQPSPGAPAGPLVFDITLHDFSDPVR
jgi:peptidylprolyl isomerase